MSRLALSLAMLGACLSMSASGAAAQVYVPPPINYGIGIQNIRNSQMLTLRQMVERNAIRKRQYGSGGQSMSTGRSLATKGRSGAGRVITQTPPAAGATDFRSGTPVIVPTRWAANFPEQRKEAEQFFVDLLEDYKTIMRQKGVAQNDVARAASFAVAISHDVYSEGRDLTEQQLEGLRRQMREIFAEDEEFQRLGDLKKQELYESYAIVGMYLSGASSYESKGNYQKEIAEMRRLARLTLENVFSVPVNRLSFTDGGVKYR